MIEIAGSQETPWRPRRLWHKPTFCASVFILGVFVLVAIFSRWLMPHDPMDFVTDMPFAPPSRQFWLGTDYLGRDILSRLIDGTFLTLTMALLATALAHLIGGTLGILAALRGGILDAILSRTVDIFLSLPKIIVGLVVVAALGPSIGVIVGVAAGVYSAGVFRIARALGADLARMDFVVAARARGEGLGWIIVGEILPHVIGPLAADFALRMAFAILFLSSMSFLGLGVQPPRADWGGMIHDNVQSLSSGSFAAVFPALAIACVSISFNMLVDEVGEHNRTSVTR